MQNVFLSVIVADESHNNMGKSYEDRTLSNLYNYLKRWFKFLSKFKYSPLSIAFFLNIV